MLRRRKGDAQGGIAPLAGGAGSRTRASVFGWRAACFPAWGEPARPGLPPEGETGKGEIQFLAAADSGPPRPSQV
jgi:hypothetical protein